MGLYAGMDLHSSNCFVGIMEKESGRRVYGKKLVNDLAVLLAALEPFRQRLQGLAVESTSNWYWLVDGLMDAGFRVHLANPAGIKQYEGLKYVDDRHDAFWLAHLLSLGILPEGYIYPKEDRPVRDLLRKRSFLVRQRTAHILSFQAMMARQTGQKMRGAEVKKLKAEDMERIFKEEYLVLSARASASCIEFLSHQIKRLERAIKEKIKIRAPFEYLLTAPGIGEILALTIMLEVGDIKRFPQVGNFSSYCRCVPSKRISNGKSKGRGNRKNGNKYLAWAFVEAAHFAQGKNIKLKRYYQRKAAQTNKIVASKALSHKLARACYYIMRDRVPFREEALFC